MTPGQTQLIGHLELPGGVSIKTTADGGGSIWRIEGMTPKPLDLHVPADHMAHFMYLAINAQAASNAQRIRL